MHKMFNVLYTIWIGRHLGRIGEKSCFAYPCRLQGGGQQKIYIGGNTSFSAFCILGCWEYYGQNEHYSPKILIGNDCHFGEYCHISTINQITIDDGLLTGRFVYIGDNAHGSLSLEESELPPAQRPLTSKGGISIGRNVWIGDKVSILGGVTIGNNVIIGAGSIVTHDIPSNSLAAGIPAKIIKQL